MTQLTGLSSQTLGAESINFNRRGPMRSGAPSQESMPPPTRSQRAKPHNGIASTLSLNGSEEAKKRALRGVRFSQSQTFLSNPLLAPDESDDERERGRPQQPAMRRAPGDSPSPTPDLRDILRNSARNIEQRTSPTLSNIPEPSDDEEEVAARLDERVHR
ncbi:hypothetical protein NX059_012390 [Plenodomus lindquistii]|nr:hypothetical protein NX059_012390 [Plenodomus lindquistii]